jgi:hypothetical protein
MKTAGIERDKSAEVRARTKAALAVAATTQHETQRKTQRKGKTQRLGKGGVADVLDSDIQDAVNVNVELVLSHRRSIATVARLEEKLIKELDSEPTRLYLASYQGKIISKVVALAVSERAATLLNLANTQAKRIALERQAFNIDDTSGADDPLAAFFNEVARHVKPLVSNE